MVHSECGVCWSETILTSCQTNHTTNCSFFCSGKEFCLWRATEIHFNLICDLIFFQHINITQEDASRGAKSYNSLLSPCPHRPLQTRWGTATNCVTTAPCGWCMPTGWASASTLSPTSWPDRSVLLLAVGTSHYPQTTDSTPLSGGSARNRPKGRSLCLAGSWGWAEMTSLPFCTLFIH